MSSYEIHPLSGDYEQAARELRAAATHDLRRVYRPRWRGGGTAPVARKVARQELVASRNGAVLGVVEYLKRGEGLFLRGLAVHPCARREGVAGALIAHLKEMARAAGISRLELATIVETGNVSIFERLGFRVTDIAPAEAFESLDGGTVMQARMVLDLHTAA